MPLDFSLPATDGAPLCATFFEATGARKGVVVVNSAAAVKRGYYARFAGWLATQGYDVVSYDYRGIGDSRPKGSLRGFTGTLTQWGEADFAGALDWALREAAPKPTVDAWLGFFPEAVVAHRHLAPADAGVKAIGHFGFFRPTFEHTPRPQAAQWLAAQASGPI